MYIYIYTTVGNIDMIDFWDIRVPLCLKHLFHLQHVFVSSDEGWQTICLLPRRVLRNLHGKLMDINSQRLWKLLPWETNPVQCRATNILIQPQSFFWIGASKLEVSWVIGVPLNHPFHGMFPYIPTSYWGTTIAAVNYYNMSMIPYFQLFRFAGPKKKEAR